VGEIMDFIDKIYKELGQNDANQDVSDWLSTGYLPLNKAISEIFGGPSSGKTLQATMALIETQQRDGLAVFLDWEHAFSIRRAVALGLSDDKYSWIYKQPETAEVGFKIIEFIVKAVRDEHPEKYVTVVCDSVAAMATEEELKAGYDGQNMKTRLSLAAVLSSSLKQLAAMVSKTNVTLLFLNQTRDNPGVMFGSKEKTSGGNALKFYASTRIKLSKTGKIKDDDDGSIVGENVNAQVVKNKVFEPFQEAEYITHFTNGINLEFSHIKALRDVGKMGDTKGWVVLDGEKWRVKDLAQRLKEDPDLYAKLLTLFEE
jgi:recombination protein RecA